jgi:hypothetical protein
LFLLAESHWPELFTHSPLADHPARQISCLFDIILRTRRHVLEHKLFGHSATEQDNQISEQIFPGISMLFVHRQLLREP